MEASNASIDIVGPPLSQSKKQIRRLKKVCVNISYHGIPACPKNNAEHAIKNNYIRIATLMGKYGFSIFRQPQKFKLHNFATWPCLPPVGPGLCQRVHAELLGVARSGGWGASVCQWGWRPR